MADSVQVKVADLEHVELTATIRLSVAMWREVVERLPLGHPLRHPLHTTLRSLGQVIEEEIVNQEICGILHPDNPAFMRVLERGHAGPCGHRRG